MKPAKTQKQNTNGVQTHYKLLQQIIFMSHGSDSLSERPCPPHDEHTSAYEQKFRHR